MSLLEGKLSPYGPSRPSGSGSGSGPHWQDPRSSSTQSLVPTGTDRERREKQGSGVRTLLAIYIHGFYGNNRSFKSFPAHVHAYLRDALADSHVVHTKVYPRYKTYHAIGVGAEKFSEWLSPHEDKTTDVVLVGHSMGGILAAEVVLMPNPDPFGSFQFKHRILGVIALDTPFLGLHPGIIPAGISSLFRSDPEKPTPNVERDTKPDGRTASAPELTQELTASTMATTTTTASPSPRTSLQFTDSNASQMESQVSNLTLSDSQLPPAYTPQPQTQPQQSTPAPPSPGPLHPDDPGFNPPWFNDTLRRERSFFSSVVHFTKKHFAEGILSAAGKHLLSHMEYASCLADYRALHARYNDLRALEDVDDLKALAERDEGVVGPSFRLRPARVRFVNYYTASTGRPKKPKVAAPETEKSLESSGEEGFAKTEDGAKGEGLEKAPTARISIEVHDEKGDSLTLLDSMESPSLVSPAQQVEPSEKPPQDPNLPEIPPPPSPPPPYPGPETEYPDKQSRKQAEKESKSLQKAYDHALKAREKLLKQRDKYLDKRRRQAEKEAEKEARLATKAAAAAPSTPLYDEDGCVPQNHRQGEATGPDAEEGSAAPGAAKKKERKFCAVPKGRSGERDRVWISVFMDGMDEVEAHCGLFLSGPHYEGLVGDIGGRIVGWVQEDLSRRAIAEMGGEIG